MVDRARVRGPRLAGAFFFLALVPSLTLAAAPGGSASSAGRPDAGPPPAAGAKAPSPEPAPGGAQGIEPDELRRIPGRIAFISERHGDKEVYLLRPSGEEERLTRSPTQDFPAAVIRDGSALAVVSVEEKDGLHLEQLWVHPLGGGAPKAVGPRGGRARNPSWSPDGRWLVFESDSVSFSDLFRVGRDGGGLKQLTRNPEGNFEPAVSPDGRQIAFVSSRDGDPELYRVGADGSRPQRLTSFHYEDWAPRWSPDGKRIAFLSNRERVDRVYVMDANGARLRTLTGRREGDEPPLEEGGHVWSPDGTRIAYVTRRTGERARIWVADLRTGARQALTSGAQGDEMPEWSPDGRYIVFVSDRAGDPELFLMRADGSGQTRLTRAPGADWLPRWVPASPAAKRAP